MNPQLLPRAVHGVPAFFAGLSAAVLAGMSVIGAGAVASGEPLFAALIVTLGVAPLAVLLFGPIAAIAFLLIFPALRALGAFRPVPSAAAFACFALTLGLYLQGDSVGILAFGVSGLVFGWVSGKVLVWAAARDAA